ncbi:O-acetylhomoserine aminocarboxypropyltransferase/cysteine synthase family protein [Lentisphaerota bacterium WC36G]|nr:O-acetylhomoserine aminocarboxypropyltransferase/cysteine synthase [Lentisphaerae bacterium WC36]
MDNWNIETKLIQCGYQPKSGEPRVVPITQSTTYKYDTCAEVAALFDLESVGHMYSRISNPTVSAFEEKMTALENGVTAVATASGQTASMLSILNVCSSGQSFIATSNLYGGTANLFTHTMKNFGVEVIYVDQNASLEELLSHVKENTRAIFAESLANPAMDVLDFDKFSKFAKTAGIPLIVDNTFPTPFLCNPIDLGAHIVVHSSTKYIDGHATSVGGVIIDGGKFDWNKYSEKFPGLTTPDKSYHGLIYTEAFGNMAYGIKVRTQLIRDTGAYMSPMNAFLSNNGLETLHLRMERHCKNAQKIAEFLATNDKISWIKYPGLAGDENYNAAKKYLKGCSGVFTFGVKGGAEAGEKFMNALNIFAIVVHVADLRSSVLHPASMTHRQLDEQEQLAAGVTPDLIRMSVGLENADDLIADIEQALAQI